MAHGERSLRRLSRTILRLIGANRGSLEIEVVEALSVVALLPPRIDPRRYRIKARTMGAASSAPTPDSASLRELRRALGIEDARVWSEIGGARGSAGRGARAGDVGALRRVGRDDVGGECGHERVDIGQDFFHDFRL